MWPAHVVHDVKRPEKQRGIAAADAPATSARRAAARKAVRCSRAASDGVREAMSIFGRYACMQRETASPNGQKSQ